MSKTIKEVALLHNGKIAVTDDHDAPVIELQRPLHELWAEFAISKGFNPEGAAFNNRGLLTHSEQLGWQCVTRHEYHLLQKAKEQKE